MIAEHVHNALRESHDAQLTEPDVARRCAVELRALREHLREAYDLARQLGFAEGGAPAEDPAVGYLAELEAAA